MANFVTLTTFDNSIEAHIVKNLLESEQIAVFLVGEHFFNSQKLLNLELAHIRLQVPKKQQAQAKQVLTDFNQGIFEQPLIETYALQAIACKNCGCLETIEQSSVTSKVTTFVLALYFIGVVIPTNKFKVCEQCKTKISEEV